MSILSTTTKLVATSITGKSIISNKYAKGFINQYFNKKEVDNSLSTLSFLNFQKHLIKTFDDNLIEANELRINNDNNYVLILHGFNQKNDDFIDIVNGFLLADYNVVLISNRLNITYSVKECFDLLYVINYFVSKNPDIKICLFGEYEGANIIIKALKSKMDSHVKCCIVDDPNTNLKNDLLNNYFDNTKINIKSLETIINHELKSIYHFDLNDLSLNDCLTDNEIPICFIYSKIKSNFAYRNLLKIYNQNKLNQKFFYTNSLNRNFEDENYFLTLKKFIDVCFK